MVRESPGSENLARSSVRTTASRPSGGGIDLRAPASLLFGNNGSTTRKIAGNLDRPSWDSKPATSME